MSACRQICACPSLNFSSFLPTTVALPSLTINRASALSLRRALFVQLRSDAHNHTSCAGCPLSGSLLSNTVYLSLVKKCAIIRCASGGLIHCKKESSCVLFALEYLSRVC